MNINLLNIIERLKNYRFKPSHKPRPIVIEIQIHDLDSDAVELKSVEYSNLTTHSNDISVVDNFGCDCIQIKWHEHNDITETILFVKRFLFKKHHFWLCHSLVFTIHSNFLLKSDKQSIIDITNLIEKNILSHLGYNMTCYINCGDLAHCQKISIEALHNMLILLGMNSINLNADFEELVKKSIYYIQTNENQKNNLLLLANIIHLRKKINTFVLSFTSRKIHFRKIFLDSTFLLDQETIDTKCYRFKIIYYLSKTKKTTYIIISTILILLALIFLYQYNVNIIDAIISMKYSHSLDDKIKKSKLNRHYILSFPYINTIKLRHRLYKKDLAKLRSIAKYEIQRSLLDITGYTDTQKQKQRTTEYNFIQHHFPYKMISHSDLLPILPIIFLKSTTKSNNLNDKLLKSQITNLHHFYVKQYLQNHIHTINQAINLLENEHLLKIDIQPTSFKKNAKLYTLLTSIYKSTDNYQQQQIIRYTQALLIKKFSSIINANWHEEVTNPILQKILELHKLGLTTNIDKLYTHNKKSSNQPFSITPIFLSSKDKFADLTIGNQEIQYAHGPQIPLLLNNQSIHANHCRVSFTSFDGRVTTTHINRPFCLSLLFRKSSHWDSNQTEIIYLSDHHQTFSISMKESQFQGLITHKSKLPHAITIKGDPNAA